MISFVNPPKVCLKGLKVNFFILICNNWIDIVCITGKQKYKRLYSNPTIDSSQIEACWSENIPNKNEKSEGSNELETESKIVFSLGFLFSI